MNQYDAEKHCTAKGSRMPTAREFVQMSQSMGARGIRETAHKNLNTDDPKVQAEIKAMEVDTFYAIYTKNDQDELVVDFYFSFSDYKRPEGDLGNFWFWSSSVHPYYPDSTVAYLFGGQYGGIASNLRSIDAAVRCVAQR